MTSIRRGRKTDLTYYLRQVASGGAIGCVALCMHGVVLAADASVAAPAPASDSESDEDPRYGHVEDIVVTAEKRAESLQNVPLSLAALSSEELQRLGITSFNELMGGQVPSLKLEPFAGNPAELEVAIRGFTAPLGINITNENPVPLYIDDVYYGRQTATSLQLDEIDRIEVLRGPQGTLFGRNAEGGAVRIISKAPTGNFGIREQVEGGNFGYWRSLTHLDLPSVADVATKIDLLATDDNGWQTNPANGENNLGRVKATAARFTALWKPSDTLGLEYSYDWMQLKSTSVYNQQLATNDLYQYLAPGFTRTIWPIQTSRADAIPYPIFRPLDSEKFTGHRLTGTWALSDTVALKSIAAYRKDSSPMWQTSNTSVSIPGAFIGAPYPYLTDTSVLFDIRHSQFSEELQLTGKSLKLNWVIGLFFLNEHASQTDTTHFGTAFPNAVTTGAPGFLPIYPGNAIALDPPQLVPNSATGAMVHNLSYAAFGQATWRPGFISDNLSYTLGLRVNHDEKDATRTVGGVFNNVTYPVPPSTALPNAPYNCTLNPRPVQCTNDTSQSKALPMASVAYDWDLENMSYVRYSTGYQGSSIGIQSQIFKAIASSTVNSIEVGHKSEFLDRKARVNLAAFYLNWQKPQETVQTASTQTVELFNGPDINISGVELDSSFLPFNDLTVNLSVTYLNGSQDMTLNPFPNPFLPTTSNIVQDKLVGLPKWASSVAVSWDLARTRYGTWRLDVDANTTTSYFSVPQVSTPIGPYTLVNGRFGLASIPLGTDSTLDITLWGKNLTDRSYATFVYQVPAAAALNNQQPAVGTDGTFGPPRTYGLSVSLKF